MRVKRLFAFPVIAFAATDSIHLGVRSSRGILRASLAPYKRQYGTSRGISGHSDASLPLGPNSPG